MEYFNMGMIILITSFDPTSFTSSVKGTKAKVYNSFETEWYEEQGIKICMALFLSSITTNYYECQKISL